MKINMTIREIMDNYEGVMDKVVDYQIHRHQVLTVKDTQIFLSITYRLLAEIQALKKNIYGANQN